MLCTLGGSNFTPSITGVYIYVIAISALGSQVPPIVKQFFLGGGGQMAIVVVFYFMKVYTSL